MVRQFLSAREGSVFAIVALGIMAIVGSVGVAVDVGRAQMVQAKLQAAVDAAGLSAGATVNSSDLTAVANKYISLNFTQGIMGSSITGVTTTLSTDQQILTVTAHASMPTTFMKIFGQNTVTVDATTEITRTNKGMELALVLDTTGSMAGSKLASLKTASHDLLDILFGSEATSDNLWVGVVPFTQGVNVGASHTDWLNQTDFASRDWGTTTWAGCMESRWGTNNRDVTDDPPAVELFRAYYWPDDSNNNWIGSGSNTICSGSGSCSCGSTPNCSCSGSGSSRVCTQTTTTYSISSSKGPNRYCPSAITPLTNVKATVDSGIDALVAGGNTEVNEGAAWGWRLISPRWRGLWGGSMNTNNLPLDYNTPLMVKAVIIMTDGENTISNSSDGSYDYLSANRLGTTNSSTAVTKLNSKLTTVCNALKAQNILVYTILFEENTASVITLMQDCATNPDYFFNSPDEASLQAAFHVIGDSLANLRISH